jgi:pimeloyl-ACP methyl ester carboxylesterase
MATVAEVVSDLGHGPIAVLLHGVGFGPETLDTVAATVAEQARAVVVRRPAPATGSSLRHQAAAVAAAVEHHTGGEGYVVAGVSGGATLAVALAAATDAPLLGVVAHEPLVGRHAPALWDAVHAAHDALARGDATPDDWFRGLIGPAAWGVLDPASRDAALAGHPDLLAEITPFVSWDPTADQLGTARRCPLVTSVGSDSGPARHEAAAALATLAGARVVDLAGGHLVQFDDPGTFAGLIARSLEAP